MPEQRGDCHSHRLPWAELKSQRASTRSSEGREGKAGVTAL